MFLWGKPKVYVIRATCLGAVLAYTLAFLKEDRVPDVNDGLLGLLGLLLQGRLLVPLGLLGLLLLGRLLVLLGLLQLLLIVSLQLGVIHIFRIHRLGILV